MKILLIFLLLPLSLATQPNPKDIRIVLTVSKFKKIECGEVFSMPVDSLNNVKMRQIPLP